MKEQKEEEEANIKIGFWWKNNKKHTQNDRDKK